MDPERERIAKIEIGHTDVSPVLARALIAVFLVAIATVPIVDLLTGRAASTGVTPSSLAAVGSVARQEGLDRRQLRPPAPDASARRRPRKEVLAGRRSATADAGAY